MKSFKHLGAILMLTLLVPLFAAFASAIDMYSIEKVQVNGVEINGDKAQVDIGQSVEVIVEIKSGLNLSYSTDAKISVEIDGYEHDSLRASTDMFTVSPGVKYRKTLAIELPTDMEADTYAFYVRVSDKSNVVEKRFDLVIEPTRHLVDVVGIVVPTPYILAGQTASVKVRLENVGKKTEDNVKVVAAIEKLGVSDVDWLDLVPSEVSGDDDEKSETVTLMLPIPKDTATGTYELAVGIAYDDGHKTSVATASINVKGVEKEVPKDVPAGASVSAPKDDAKPLPPEKVLTFTADTTSQNVAQGKEVAYKISFSNLGADSKTLSLSVAGAQLFGDVRIDPSSVTIPNGQKADVYAYAKAKKDAEQKVHQFTVRVLDGEKLFKEIQLSASVEEAAVEAKSGNMLPLDDETLKIAFIVLVIVLIIVGLLIAFRRVKGSDYPIEPLEERTYY